MKRIMNLQQMEYIIDEYADMMFRIAFQYVRKKEDAEDICQNVFEKLLKYEKTFDTHEHEKACIIRITMNQCKDYVKSAWNKHRCDMPETMEIPMEDSNGKSDILELIRELKIEYRDVIYLYYYEGYSVEEIANLLHKKKGTIKTWLSRGREQLGKMITGKD